MKFVKRLNLNQRFPESSRLSVEANGKIVTNTKASLQIPAGGTTDRVETYQNGQIRYNTDYQEFEGYINGQWEFLRTRRQANIQFQTVATGNYVNTIYGPLSYRQNASKPENVLVFVENVYQIPTVNYNLVNDPVVQKATVGVTNPGVTVLNIVDQVNINVGQVVSGDIAIAPGTTVVSLSTVTSSVVISGATLGTIQASVSLNFAFSTGTFVSFTSAPPIKPVYALSGFDGYFPPFNQ
jgi:hypothetical protein